MKDRLLNCLLLALILWLALPSNIQAQYDTDPCIPFPNGTKIRHPDDCGQEIICIDFKSVSGTKCSGSKPFYNKDTNKCEAQLFDDRTCSINCTNMVSQYVADPKSCYGYYYCQNEQLAIHGRCPNLAHFDQSKQSCVNPVDSQCRANKLNYCAIVSSGVKFKDHTNCGRYNECVFNKTTNMLELKNLYCSTKAMFFNAVRGACVEERIEGCHPVPKDVCVVNKIIKRNYFVNDGFSCQGSYYCGDVGRFADDNPQWIKCSGNRFFSQAKQKCLDPKQVLCLKDRCEGSDKTFVVSSRKGCRHFLICKDNVKVGEDTCGNNFFDEELGMCTPEIKTYPACYHK